MKKFLIIICSLFVVCGCATSHLEDGKESVVTFDEGGISAQDLYEKLKYLYGTDALITLIDTELLSREYKETNEEKAYISQVVSSLKNELGDNFSTYILNNYGAKNESELKEYIRLSYRRNLWKTDYAESQVNDTQINDYYNDHFVGDIEASHILIKVNTKQDATDDEKKKAEEDALNKAKTVIDRLNNGEKFEDIAKELSDDTANKNDGGKLDKFNDRSSLDENFLDAAIKLEVGKYSSTPVKSQFGYHIIYKKSQADKPELKDVKDEVIAKVAKDTISQDSSYNIKALLGLREKYGIKITDSDLEKAYNEAYKL